MKTLEEAKQKFHKLKNKLKIIHSSTNSSFTHPKSIDTAAKTTRTTIPNDHLEFQDYTKPKNKKQNFALSKKR